MSTIQTCNTWREINAQPGIWRLWAKPLANQAAEIRAWIADKGIEQVLFCGAGTSAFIGMTLAVSRPGQLQLAAVPTTDIVANPFESLRDDPKLLVVQFGRSGDSSESVATLDLLDQHFPRAHRLHVTCNAEGALATRPCRGPGEQRVLLLPAATHDSGFAMTSSYSTMLLSALACLEDSVDVAARLLALADAADTILTQVARSPARPERAVFLGSGALTGAARESALKVLELTAGQVMTSWDSTLGFRHGPKASVVGNTRVVVLIHPEAHTARYDRDIAAEIAQQFPSAQVTTIGTGACDIHFTATGDARWDAVLYVLAAQVWSVGWSADLGLNIDNPFADQGNLTRVVTGVTIYPLSA